MSGDMRSIMSSASRPLAAARTSYPACSRMPVSSIRLTELSSTTMTRPLIIVRWRIGALACPASRETRRGEGAHPRRESRRTRIADRSSFPCELDPRAAAGILIRRDAGRDLREIERASVEHVFHSDAQRQAGEERVVLRDSEIEAVVAGTGGATANTHPGARNDPVVRGVQEQGGVAEPVRGDGVRRSAGRARI